MSCFWVTSIAMGLWRQTQQDTRKNLFKPVFSFLLGFKRLKKKNLATHMHTKTQTLLKLTKKKLKNKITVGKMCRSWKMLWRFRRAIQESHMFSVSNFALINFQLEVSCVFFLIRGNTCKLGNGLGKKKQAWGFSNIVLVFCTVCNTIVWVFSTTNALLHTAALYLFRLKWKKK